MTRPIGSMLMKPFCAAVSYESLNTYSSSSEAPMAVKPRSSARASWWRSTLRGASGTSSCFSAR